ncbi:MAG: SDR family oxidoreductase [Chloroflexi bacterium]|jgi:3-oxoacyl-[acyl-carrier protein] reductase|nr:SDR family oxidoreductase [Chloroflexota bacterium]HLG51709.1 SDR family oxidoreductase [Chloroflexota bacterium]
MDLRGKVALVTGGGTGLGRVISQSFAREGMHVAVNYSRSEAEANETVSMLRGMGVQAIAVRADVSKAAEVRAMVDRVMSEFGRIDVLMNNAGTTVFVPFSDLEGVSEEDWDRIMAVNVKGAWLCAKAVAPIMKRQGQGRIIQTTSISGLRAGGSSLPYTVSKAALTMLTRGLALALAPEITVNAIAPGLIDTRWGRAWGDRDINKAIEEAPLKRLPSLEDCAAAVVLLARSDSMTGQTIVVDGGRYMH